MENKEKDNESASNIKLIKEKDIILKNSDSFFNRKSKTENIENKREEIISKESLRNFSNIFVAKNIHNYKFDDNKVFNPNSVVNMLENIKQEEDYFKNYKNESSKEIHSFISVSVELESANTSQTVSFEVDKVKNICLKNDYNNIFVQNSKIQFLSYKKLKKNTSSRSFNLNSKQSFN